jgi:hypothetical protein
MRALGRLESVHLAYDEDQPGVVNAASAQALLGMAASNADTLQALHLHARCGVAVETLLALLQLLALSRLRTLEADVRCARPDDAGAVLRNERPFERLRVRSLHVSGLRDATPAALQALVADLAAHAPQPRLCVRHVNLADDGGAALRTLVDAALTCRLARLELFECRLAPACVPAIARLLSGDALTALTVIGDQSHLRWEHHLLHAAADESTEALAAALRGSASLTSLTLHTVW